MGVREELADELAAISARHAHDADRDVRTVARVLFELSAMLSDEEGAAEASASKLLAAIKAEAAPA
jgi:hypothetical protein